MRRALALLWPALCTCATPPPPLPQPAPAEELAATPESLKARAYFVKDQSQLIGGPTATGKVGDIRLDNGLVTFIVDRAGPGFGFAHTGGNLVDADLARGGNDLLNQIFLYLDDQFPRQADYHEVIIADDGARSGVASVIARGVESEDSELSVETEYRLSPGVTGLRITTKLVSTKKDAVTDFELGDAVQWGAVDHFAPGFGNKVTGRRVSVPWVAGLGVGTSYAMAVKMGTLDTLSGNSWSDPIVARVDIGPGQSVAFERWLFVGAGDVSSLLAPVLALRGETRGLLRGRIVEEGTREPISGARFFISRDGAPYSSVASGEGGIYLAPLPPGSYQLDTATFGRNGPHDIPVAVVAGADTALDLTLSLQGRVRWEIDTEDDAPSPAKLTFEGIAPYESPLLGPAHYADGAVNTVLTALGRGERHMSPGKYMVYVSRGVEYDLTAVEITVDPGAVSLLKATLRRAVKTPGWISADFHQHAKNSYDAAVTLRDRVISNLAEGVELMVGTDHNWVTDYAPEIEKLGAGKLIHSVIGNEATTHTVGHFNCFPYTHRPDQPMGGSFQAEGMTPRAIFARCRQDPLEKVVQVNHPRGAAPVKGTGYFDEIHLSPDSGATSDPAWDDSFDAVELFNGKRIKDAERVIADWFHLLNRGRRYTATGNSDTHQIHDNEAGYPRNFVYLGTDAPDAVSDQELVRAVKQAKRIIVSNGPFVDLAVEGAPIGSTVKPARKGEVKAWVQVQAPNWVSVDKLEVVVNGAVVKTMPIDPELTAPLRLEQTLSLAVKTDSWVVALVHGSKSLSPVIPEGKTGPMTALALTNPIWIDADGDGKIAPPVK